MHKDESSRYEWINKNGREDKKDLNTQEICLGKKLFNYNVRKTYRMLKGE